MGKKLEKHKVDGDLLVLDNNGEVIISCCEIENLPSRKSAEGKNSVALNRAKQIATDLFARLMTLPGKTVKITFDPAVQKGLESGVYEVVKASSGKGKRLMARAVDSKKTVGHGRFMEADKLKQLSVCAFHIVSIAVAQAHLEEINKNLKEVNQSIKGIRDFLEDKDTAQLRGTIEYLKYIAEFVRRKDSPDQLPSEKRTELESIRREIMIWIKQIKEEARRLAEIIKIQVNEDGWSGGTGKTFKKLEEHTRSLKRLVSKYRLLLGVASIFYITSAYLDPIALKNNDAARFLRAETGGYLRIANFQLVMKSDELLTSSAWNTSSTLKLRKQKIRQAFCQLAEEIPQVEKDFTDGMGRLKNRLNRIGDSKGNVHMAITFDSDGNPEHAEFF